MSIVTYENVDTPIFDIYYPRYLFASGEDGSLLPELSAPVDSLFQDSAGTIPVTAYGDYVGLAVDQSGNGRDWVQSTNAARMRYDELADQPILYADLADDAMDIELPAITGGTIVLAGDKGIWIDEFDFAGGTFSYGPTTYTGGPEGLIEGLVGERLIGGFVIDRALTATERAQNIQYYKDRGAPGVWEWSENLWGDDIQPVGAGWTDNGDGSYTGVSAGSGLRGDITRLTDGDYLHLEATVDLEAGRLRFIAYGETTSNIIYSVPTSGITEINEYASLTAPGGARTQCLYVVAYDGLAFTGTVSNISLRKLELVT